MNLQLPPDALDRPAAETARRIALAYLHAATEARDRWHGADPEGLHDLRVALRRLRSCLRTFRDELADSVPGKRRRRLRAITATTGAGRDADVQLAWIAAEWPTLTRRQRAGASSLRARVNAERTKHDATLQRALDHDLARLARRLDVSLRRWRVVMQLDEEPAPVTTAHVLGVRLDALVDDLARAIADVPGPADQERAHRARIAAKRLRYALDPLAGLDPDADALGERLKTLQDVLGDLHDAHVLSGVVADALDAAARAAARRVSALVRSGKPLEGVRPAGADARDPRPGLLELARRLQSRTQSLFARFAEEWAGERAAPFVADAHALAATLRHRHVPGTEIERKYLLTGMPVLPSRDAGVVAEDLEQGYLPGAQILERLRAVTRDGATRWYRTVKAGVGIVRRELEDEIDHAVFETVWPLTHGRRLRKRRFTVPDDTGTWQIDEFLDRDLVLAEIELDAADAVVTIPDWLAPVVDRDVTGEPEFLNASLAR